ncbi:hypothetical protein E4U17_005429 [Claviceps sp. LM77 group G4]|nr:hypothetical protein E4U17_005429 [Claviceps sp. LM77 group G4]KAG6066195.1 hypothetical protein E4U33_005642 [Claviceps sp. LM78 group G4]KAG6075347.1 hypothetical protein E4U16_003405 [Claviceps sp. LM84 group G4]
MKVSAAILSALVAPSAALSFWNVDAQKGISSNEDLKIPGQSPLEYCPDKKSEGYIKIYRIDLAPNPPAVGKDLVIKATGSVMRSIENGAYIDLTVKYGLIRLIATKADLCEQIGEVDLKCPLNPGDISIIKTVKLPNEIPPGTYTVTADVFSARHERITCLTTTVKFNMNGLGESDDGDEL